MSQTMVVVLGMAGATYATRFFGPLVMSYLRLGPRGEAFFRALPGSILAALVAPAVLGGGPAEWGAALAAVAAARLGGMLPALVAGAGTVYLLRAASGG